MDAAFVALGLLTKWTQTWNYVDLETFIKHLSRKLSDWPNAVSLGRFRCLEEVGIIGEVQSVTRLCYTPSDSLNKLNWGTSHWDSWSNFYIPSLLFGALSCTTWQRCFCFPVCSCILPHSPFPAAFLSLCPPATSNTHTHSHTPYPHWSDDEDIASRFGRACWQLTLSWPHQQITFEPPISSVAGPDEKILPASCGGGA